MCKHNNLRLYYTNAYEVLEDLPISGFKKGDVFVMDDENNVYKNVDPSPYGLVQLAAAKGNGQVWLDKQGFLARDYYVCITRIQYPKEIEKDSAIAREIYKASVKRIIKTKED